MNENIFWFGIENIFLYKIFLGDRHIVWRRGYDVLATGHIVIAADPRISVERHAGVNTLSIREVAEQDAGEYVCQVRRLTSVT